jgi:DNA-binding response OmpR family regulator
MGGDIHVESKVGHGTRFVLSIPFQKAPAPTAAIQATPVRPDNGQPLVLITEDNPELRQYICEQLQEQYQIIEAAEGQTGLQMAQEQLPDLILSDVRMPGMDGLDFCQAIKTDERSSHIPVILLTALADQEDVRTGLLTGADAYLTKPFDAEELRIRVGQLIQQRRQLREKFARSLKDSPAPVEAENTADAVFLRKVEQAVMSQLDEEDFSIEALGRAVGMSRSQLHRKIKALTDQSPSVFVRTLRLREAYRLLQAKAGNVSEVAHQVGMPNLAHFSRSFKDLFGHPPSQIS